MEKFDATKYKKEIKQAVDLFWETRFNQKTGRKKTDQGNRSSVTGGKHLDGFVELMVKVALDIGVPRDCIYTKGNVLPGFFRPTKELGFTNNKSKEAANFSN